MSANNKKGILATVGAIGVAAGALGTLLYQKMTKYKPPKKWDDNGRGYAYGGMNQPTAGVRSKQELKKGKHALQLYSLGTPNGVKITILLEELSDEYKIQYDAWLIRISKSEQFGSGFVDINPNSKIPALLDYTEDDTKPIRVFESASIMLYLCEHYDPKGLFLPKDSALKAECINWVMWAIGAAPYLGGGFGHFYNYAPIKIKYAIDRFSMESKRQLDVLEKHLSGELKGFSPCSGGPYICGEKYTIADMIIWPWWGNLVLGRLYSAASFLDVENTYPHVMKWAKMMWERPQVRRGRMVNRAWGDKEWQLPERHSPEDFEKSRNLWDPAKRTDESKQ